MLDTFLVLGALAVLAVIGCLMGLFGGRAFRPFAFLVGFAGGAIAAAVALNTFADMEPASTVFIIACAGVGLLIGLLSAMFRQVGLGVTGLVAGIAIGWGLLFCLDYLLNGIIPQFVYTFLSVLLAAIVAISCLSRPNTGRAFSTSIVGGFFVFAAIGLLISWFSVQRGDLARMLNLEYSAFGDFKVIASAITNKSWSLYIVAAMLLGLAMFALQRPYIKPEEAFPGLDEDDDDLYDPKPKRKAEFEQKRQAEQHEKKNEKPKTDKPKKDKPKKEKKKRRFGRRDDFDEYDDFDEQYAELDAMIKAEGIGEQPPEQTPEQAEAEAAPPQAEPDDEEYDNGDEPYDEFDDEFDDEYDDDEEYDDIDEDQEAPADIPDEEHAFDTGKITYTANGEEQPAHGPLRPKNMPDDKGFIEEAVVVDPNEVEAPTMVFEPITDDDAPVIGRQAKLERQIAEEQRQKQAAETKTNARQREAAQDKPGRPKRVRSGMPQQGPASAKAADNTPELTPEQARSALDDFDPDTFKRTKAITDNMDYKPQEGFVSRTERNKRKKKKK